MGAYIPSSRPNNSWVGRLAKLTPFVDFCEFPIVVERPTKVTLQGGKNLSN